MCDHVDPARDGADISATMQGWYFSTEARRLRFGDNRAIVLGETHTFDGEPVLCEAGLHASERIIDALDYAPGSIVWRVTLGGKIVRGDDKAVATLRTYDAGGIDVSAVLRAFARRCALGAAHLWDCPDVVRRFLETCDDSLRAAASAAASAAARDAARDAQNATLTALIEAAIKEASDA